MSREVDLLDFLIIIAKKKRLILINFIIISIISLTIALIWSKSYKSDLVFIPQGKGGSGLLSLLGNGINADIIGGSSFSKRQYSALLTSRELREELINKFDLITVYENIKKPNPLDYTLRQLENNIQITETEEGGLGITDVISITISVLDEDPNRASEMANYLFSLLEKKTRFLNSGEYENVSKFLREQILKCDNSIDSLRVNLKSFQIKHHIYSVPEQLSMVMQSYAMTKSELLTIDKEISYLSKIHNPDYDRLKLLKTKKISLKKILNDLEHSKKNDIFFGLSHSLDLQNEFIDLKKEVETFIQLKTLLEQQFEQARIKAEKSYTPFYLIDKARPAEYKFKPKRVIILLAILIPYMFILILFLFLNDYYRNVKNIDPEQMKKIDLLIYNLKS